LHKLTFVFIVQLFLRGKPQLQKYMRRLPKLCKKVPTKKCHEPDFYALDKSSPLPPLQKHTDNLSEFQESLSPSPFLQQPLVHHMVTPDGPPFPASCSKLPTTGQSLSSDFFAIFDESTAYGGDSMNPVYQQLLANSPRRFADHAPMTYEGRAMFALPSQLSPTPIASDSVLRFQQQQDFQYQQDYKFQQDQQPQHYLQQQLQLLRSNPMFDFGNGCEPQEVSYNFTLPY
jgi:hypothetical protein